MALHDPVEDALNERKRKARLVEAGAAVGSPNEDALDITKRFLTGGQRLPSQAAPIAGRSAFGQQGRKRGQTGSFQPPVDIGPYNPPLSVIDALRALKSGDTGGAQSIIDDIAAAASAPRKFSSPGGSYLRSVRPRSPGPSLSSRFLDLPGPVGFSKTPQGSAILQSILGRFSQNRLRR